MWIFWIKQSICMQEGFVPVHLSISTNFWLYAHINSLVTALSVRPIRRSGNILRQPNWLICLPSMSRFLTFTLLVFQCVDMTWMQNLWNLKDPVHTNYLQITEQGSLFRPASLLPIGGGGGIKTALDLEFYTWSGAVFGGLKSSHHLFALGLLPDAKRTLNPSHWCKQTPTFTL